MAQFDVYGNTNTETEDHIPYLLDVQADLLDSLSTRVVVPLISHAAMEKPIAHLNPGFDIEGEPVFMSTAELAGVPVRILGLKITSLKDRRDVIMAAMDFLLVGF
ncbi:MAG: CcdB family protein [Desulfococcaceae bacterium]